MTYTNTDVIELTSMTYPPPSGSGSDRTTYSWDYRNRLTDVEYYDDNSVLTKHVHFVYGVFDHLIATEADTTGIGQYNSIQHYVLDVSPEIPIAGVPGTALTQPDLEFDGNQNLIQRDLVALDPAGVDAVIVQEAVNPQGNVITWVADNNLGSPVDGVDNSGMEANHIVYAPFGQVTYESTTAAVLWTGVGGGHGDPNTGLVNDLHRWYDPATGRWLSQDPDGFLARDANLTRYASNNPLTIADRPGLSSIPYKGWWNPSLQPPSIQIPIPTPPPIFIVPPKNFQPPPPPRRRPLVPPQFNPPPQIASASSYLGAPAVGVSVAAPSSSA